MTTLKELALKHEEHFNDCSEATYSFNLDQLRALITEAVGIVAGEPVNYSGICKHCGGAGQLDDADFGDIYYNTWTCPTCNGTRTAPLHAIDIGRLG